MNGNSKRLAYCVGLIPVSLDCSAHLREHHIVRGEVVLKLAILLFDDEVVLVRVLEAYFGAEFD